MILMSFAITNSQNETIIANQLPEYEKMVIKQ